MEYTHTPSGEIENQIMVAIKSLLYRYNILHPKTTMWVKRLFLTIFLLFQCGHRVGLYAHPMPNSMIVLNIHEKHISGQILLPLSELQTAIGMGVNDHSERLVERLGDSLRTYLMAHIRPKSFEGVRWAVRIGDIHLTESSDSLTGKYKELTVQFEMSPPPNYDIRNFFFDYDVILHQVASHRALIHIKQDWALGMVREDTISQQIGVIEWDVVNGKLHPFMVSLQQGSLWEGFKRMVELGIDHIAEGLDHMLFVLTLLMATFPPSRQKNKITASWREGRLFYIITAFTVGHSLTLLLGSFQWINLPTKPIEIFIAFTILVSAFHALRPIYPQKEVLIAGLFGLIHGMAFAQTLIPLDLSTTQMFLSILGFNIGIELMQLCIIVVVFPILFLLSKTPYYNLLRTIAAITLMTLACAWMIERIQEKPNFITQWLV